MNSPAISCGALLILSLAVSGCLPGKSRGDLLDRRGFAETYSDITASVWAAKRTTSDTVALARVADSVLSARGITPEQYRRTVEWYNADAERWRGFYDEVTKILEDRSRREAERAAELRASTPPSAR